MGEDVLMTGLAQVERHALCLTLERVGPLAPTLCEGWLAKDLAAHLVLRERRPDTLPGAFLPILADHTQRVQDSYAEQSWPELVDMVRAGPPGWSPTRVPAVDEAINLAEFFVHHEDVLRAAPGWTPEQARALPAELQDALWARLRSVGQLLFRRSEVGVVLVTPAQNRKTVHGPTKTGSVVLSGEPSELLLFGFGRGRVANVQIEGDPAAAEALRTSDFGL
jgi:uncharacterized protein (TIGR03085 family)